MVFVLFDPAKSADPPIKVLVFLVKVLSTNSEDFLVAKLFKSLAAFFFSIFIDLAISFNNSLLILILLFDYILFHLVSIFDPLLPIFFHSL